MKIKYLVYALLPIGFILFYRMTPQNKSEGGDSKDPKGKGKTMNVIVELHSRNI
jgi:membrane fusion protein (multidrug efflux system)